MKRLPYLFAWVLLGLMTGSATAQDGPAPQAYLTHTGADPLLADLKDVMSLTTPEEQKQYDRLKDYLDLMLIGVSRDRPLRIDLLLDSVPVRTRAMIPVADEQEFWEDNLKKNGIEMNRRLRSTLYSLKGDVYPYFVRFLHDYAIFAEHVQALPYTLPDPQEEIAQVLQGGYESAFVGRNKAEGQAQRRELFNGSDGLRRELLKPLVKLKDEEQDEFDLRKALFESQLDELGRLFVEAEHVLMRSVIDGTAKTATTDLSVTPLPETSLAASFQLLNRQPSRLASVPKPSDPLLSLRVNAGLDKARQATVLRIIDQLRAMADTRIARSPDKTPSQKAAGRKAIGMVYELLERQVGHAEGFVDATPVDGGLHTLVGAFHLDEAKSVVGILETLQEAGPSFNVRLNFDTAGDVAIHSFDLDPSQRRTYQELFGSDTVYVGTSSNALWLAGGPKAIERLKATVAQVNDGDIPATADAPALSIDAHFGPWLRVRQKTQGDLGTEQQRKIRRLAIAATEPGDDRYTFWLRRNEENQVVGQATTEPGILRFFAKVIADFAKTQIPEQ